MRVGIELTKTGRSRGFPIYPAGERHPFSVGCRTSPAKDAIFDYHGDWPLECPASYRCGGRSPMLPERLFRSTLLHADPARRVIAVAKLPPQSDELAVLLATDPAPEVRIAAANCCDHLSVLAAAWENESDPAVRAALSAALRTLLSESPDSAGATALLAAAQCTDAMRADVARRAPDVERRRSAIAAIREEALLVELALTAERADTRMAAAQHVHTPDGLRKLAHAARDKDRSVARLARKRLDAIEKRERRAGGA